MGNAKNFKGHDLDKYFNDIKINGYAQENAFYITNAYNHENIKEYFKKNNLKYKIQDDMYIFTYITPPTT